MKNAYKTVYLVFLIAFVLLSSVQELKASHAMGADLTYRCLGNNQYEITFSFYRDCSGIPAPNPMVITLHSSCYADFTVSLNALPSSPTQISPICPSATSTCNGGAFTGIQEWVYQGVVTLPGPCADWTFYHSENARNAAITTITGAGGDDLFVYSVMDNTNGLCNNSPTFSNKPVPFACIGQRFCFNHGAFDVDGDSLTYQLITPRNGVNANDTISYLPGYSATQPITSVPAMTFNPLTGDFCMVPTTAEVSVMAVLVNEWRNGVLIGQVERDIQVTVIACLNTIPALTGINGVPGPFAFQASVCAGNQLCFWIRSTDPDTPNTTTVTWDNSIPGATFTTFGGHRDSAVFCWTPTSAQISNTPYCFTATVHDDNCPYMGLQVYSYCITVNGVAPDAGPDQTIPCGATANLNGSATLGNGSYTYVWNGIDSTQQLNGVGIGTYILAVTSAGCTNWDTVNVLPGLGVPAAAFTFANSCIGNPTQFTDNSVVAGSTINSWTWDFGDGNTSNVQNPTHQYGSNNTYTVTLTVSTPTGCTSSMVQQVVVNTNVPAAVFAANNVCDGTSMSFSDQSTGAGINAWSWDFNDPGSASNTSNSQNPTHTFTGPGTYNVSLQVTNVDGCQGQVQQNVVVNANPVINVPNAGMCFGTQATLNGPAGFSNYNWSSGQTSQSITVSPGGLTNYTLTVTDANGCTGSYMASVSVDQLPVPDAGQPQTICEGTSANLSASNSTGGITYEWNPGNLLGVNVTVSPSSTTTYTVTVSSNAGCSSNANVTINVNPMPMADAPGDVPLCKGESVTINSITGAGTILWTPGNFNTSSITVTPVSTTTYYLVVSDAIGCTGTDSVTIYVNPLPVAAFTNSSPVCVNNSIAFTDNSNVPSGSIQFWNWDFDDGNTSSSQNPSHSYSSSGNFNVKLLVTTNSGCKDSIVTLAIVNPLPSVNAGNDQSICPGFNATLSGNGSGNYVWNPGSLASQNITLSPAITTDYTLTVTDNNGCVNTDQASIIVNPVPIADAGPPQSVCDGSAITLFGSGGDTYLWNPGNINSQNYSITATSSQLYTLIVANSFGCLDTDVVNVQVNPIPVAAIASSGPVCEGNLVTFTDQSVVTTGSLIAWTWDFGNNTSSSVQNPTVPFYSPGNYTITLSAYSDNGCKDEVNFNQTVWATPNAAYLHTNVCDGNPISFTNTSTISDFSPLTYSWNLGDNTTTSNANVTHQYASYGSYAAFLHVVSPNGCADSVTQMVNVFALPQAAFTMDYACEDQPASFMDISTVPQGLISSWYWTMGDNSSTVETHPVHTYANPGYYDINLVVATDHGCLDSTNDVIRIVPKPTVDFATENACLGYVVDLTDHSFPSTGPIVQYNWDFGDGLTSTDQNPTHIYSSSGWFQVSLTATSDSGCITTLVRPNALQIYAPPTAMFSNNSNDANDIIPLVNFLNETSPSVFYYWNFGDGDTSTEFSPSHMYAVVGKYDVQLITVDQNGCIDSILIPIEIKPTSNIYIPNAFTPNGDANNDFFQVYSHNVVGMAVQIYDRWGLKIVEWNDVYGSWDGKVNGSPAQADTYVYRVSTKDVNAKQEVYVGHVSLVR